MILQLKYHLILSIFVLVQVLANFNDQWASCGCLRDVLVIQSCYGLLALVSFGKIFPDFCEAVLTSTRMFYLGKKLINAAHFCNNQRILSWGEQGYVILIQTGAELMRCYSFCFSIYRHFVPSFVYHFVSGLVLLCYLNQIQVI